MWLPGAAALFRNPNLIQVVCLEMAFPDAFFKKCSYSKHVLQLIQGFPFFCLTLVLPSRFSKAFVEIGGYRFLKGKQLCISLDFEQVLQHSSKLNLWLALPPHMALGEEPDFPAVAAVAYKAHDSLF